MTKLPPATMLGTEVRRMKSKATGKAYRISIALPYTYQPDPTGPDLFDPPLSAWPVVYLLDSNWNFGMVTDIVRGTACCGRTTDAIVVGIGYPEAKFAQQSRRNVIAERQVDLTPVRDEKTEKETSEWLKQDAGSGSGSKFITFLKQELIPWVDRQYRTDPSKRILAGHSFGGLFTIHAMLQEPGLFRSYVAASPSFWYAVTFMFGLEEAFAKKHRRLSAQLYLSVGELEDDISRGMVSNLYRFAAQLESRKYKGLSLTKQVFADKNHCEVVAPAFQAGLRIALSK